VTERREGKEERERKRKGRREKGKKVGKERNRASHGGAYL
jgi:hypothetical protein